MKYGYTISAEELENAIEYSVANNLKYLEINIPSHWNNTPDENFNKLTEQAFEKGLKLNFHLPFTISIADVIPSIKNGSREKLRKIINLAGSIKAEAITIHPGIFYWFPVEKWSRKKALNRLVESLLILADDCAKQNVKLALENVVPIPQGSEFLFMGDCVEDFHYIFDHVDNELLGFCLDTGHANLGEGPLAFVNELQSKIINVHFHDNLGKNDNHMIVGEGNINWTEICSGLDSINYQGPLISECREINPVESRQKLEYYFERLRSTKPLL